VTPSRFNTSMPFVIVTGEYPPYPGGVGDYTWQVVHGLRECGISVEVIVFRKSCGVPDASTHFVGPATNPISMNRARRVIRKTSGSRVLLVQYVPQAYGLKGMNLGIVLWLCGLKANPLWVMFHEVHCSATAASPWKHRLLAQVTQRMARRMAKRADHCFVSISSFVKIVEKLTDSAVPVDWLPVPSNLSCNVDQAQVNELRHRLLGGRRVSLIGHFGTYKGPIPVLVRELVERSMSNHREWKFVFIGRGSRGFLDKLTGGGVLRPGGAVASGGLNPMEAACWIKACDVMLQPYPDGASTRRGSLMAALALGKATISNLGHLSDQLWQQSACVLLADSFAADPLCDAIGKVLAIPSLRTQLENKALSFYEANFSLERTLLELQQLSRDGHTSGLFASSKPLVSRPAR
jgi:glycosyltransferase involved in cell wall biosynthesis